jgi:hypothetical protein
LKHIVEQSSFPYAHAVETWQKSLERKFEYTRDIRLIDASTVEYALGKSRVNDEQRKPGPLLAEVYEWGENVCVRGDVYAEFFKPTPLGGCDATDVVHSTTHRRVEEVGICRLASRESE